MQILSKQQIYDILYGSNLLGTGGGGPVEEGIALVDEAFSKGKQFKLESLPEIPDDEWVGVPYMCGALSTDEVKADSLKDLPILDEPMPMIAYKAMEKYIGKPFYGVVSTELGGANTGFALYVAAMLDKIIVDADPAGRSVPELSHSTFFINDMPIGPMAVADAYGNTAIFTSVINDQRAEDWARALAVVSDNSVGVVDHPAKASEMRGKVIEGALSYAMKIGEELRLSKDSGLDPAESIVSKNSGKILFKGTVSKYEHETRSGFTFGNLYLAGEESYANHTYRVWFKNEYIASWLDEKIDITVPDLICIINNETKLPVINPAIKEGMNLTVFALPAPREWTTPKGLAIFGPRYFGLDKDYTGF